MDNMFNDSIKNNFFNNIKACGCGAGMCNSPNYSEDIFSSFGKGKKVHYAACELCKGTGLCGELDKKSCRLLRVNLKLTNVCFNKDVSIAVIVKNCSGKILAFKSFTTKLTNPCDCCNNAPCGTLERKVTFVLPEGDICSPQDIFVSLKANYTNPCDSPCHPCC